MRDLGTMGESTFSFWCAEAGLVHNGSKIDRTGWDFLVEFPFSERPTTALNVHKAALECKVQVKATDKKDRKLPIKLSNLRRLITPQMPTFFVFIEFDKTNSAQRAFVVHIDNDLISQVLERLHRIEDDRGLNKKTLTLTYNDSHRLIEPNGAYLKETLLAYIGDDISDYIAKKKAHLETTGFDGGFAQLHFTAVGEQNIKRLIDSSVGYQTDVEVSSFVGRYGRFGMSSENPFVDSPGILQMGPVAPCAQGVVRFKESRLSAGIEFEAKLYISPLNSAVPEKFRTLRVEGEFFDIKFRPYSGEAEYSFSFGEGVRMRVREFRDAIKLLDILNREEARICVEMDFSGFPRLAATAASRKSSLNFAVELQALESAVRVLTFFEVLDRVDISFHELVRFQNEICQFAETLDLEKKFFKVEFDMQDEDFDASKKVACLCMTSVAIGSHIVSLILALTGYVQQQGDRHYVLLTQDAYIERKLVSKQGAVIARSDLLEEFEVVQKKYGEAYSVVTILNMAS